MAIRHAGFMCILLAFGSNAAGLELNLNQVRADFDAQTVDITVIEPHLNDPNARITYRGILLRDLLERYFPDQWRPSFEGEIHFVARDGYWAAVPAERVRSRDAYLTFARTDGKQFVIDNRLQNELKTDLDPFYLVWDNVKYTDLLKEGANGWPYQVMEIRLVSLSVYDKLLPTDAPPSIREGFAAYKQYCMNCHHLGGIGGRKDSRDMKELIDGKSADELRLWIDNPRGVNEMTKMPALNPLLDPDTRARNIDLIVEYLETL